MSLSQHESEKKIHGLYTSAKFFAIKTKRTAEFRPHSLFKRLLSSNLYVYIFLLLLHTHTGPPPPSPPPAADLYPSYVFYFTWQWEYLMPGQLSVSALALPM